MANSVQLVLVVAVVFTCLICDGAQLLHHNNNNKHSEMSEMKYQQPHHRHHHHHDPAAKVSEQQEDYYPAAAEGVVDYESDDTGSLNSSPGEEDEGDMLPAPGSYIPSNCSSCIRREELRRRNLEVIKDQILSKLGMQRAPNMTGRLPPRIPPLDHLLDLYGMQGDAPGGGLGGSFQTGPVYDEEEDDFHARTEKVIAFAQQCKFFSLKLIKESRRPVTCNIYGLSSRPVQSKESSTDQQSLSSGQRKFFSSLNVFATR